MDQNIINRMTFSLSVIERDIEHLNSSPNPAILLVQSNYLDAWHTLNKAYYDFVLQRDKISALEMLLSRNFAQSYDTLRNKMQDIILAQLNMLYVDYDDLSWLMDRSDKVIDVSTDDKEEFNKFYSKIIKDSDKPFFELFSYFQYDDFLTDENEYPITITKYRYEYQLITIDNSGLKQLSQTLHVFNRLFSFLVSYKEELIKERPIFFEDIKISVINDYKKYSLKNERETLRHLKHKAQDFKEKRSSPLGPEQWGELLAAEDDAFSLAIAGNLCQNEEERLSHIGSMMREQMEKNGALLQAILNVSRDEEVFDFEYANERHIDLYSKLTPDNLELSYDLILRRNIIQCEMFPGLRSEYEAWLNGCDSGSGKPSESLYDSETEVPASVSEVFNNTSDFIKNIVKTIIDSHYGNKPVNMALIEITLYDHSVIKERNQHQKFIEALIAWEFFDEKMKARTISGMSSKFSNLENTGYKEWKKNKKDQNKCIEIARNFDKTTPYRYKNNDLTD